MAIMKKKMFSLYRWKKKVWEVIRALQLPRAARYEHFLDNFWMVNNDPGYEAAIESSIAWLCQAQDNNKFRDGGVADIYSLINGWGPSYPETTGYIVPTFIAYGQMNSDKEILDRARRMLDWLCSIQLPDGSFQGGVVGAEPCQPTVFNTGQIVMGLAAGVAHFEDDSYRESLIRAADWLVNVQDSDGAWRKHESPFVEPGDKTYHAHVAWGLMEAEKVVPGRNYGKAAIRHINWVLSYQMPNGWFANCDLNMPNQPLTHTLGYVLRGIVEAYLFSSDPAFLQASRLTADAFLAVMEKDGYIAGRFFSDWTPAEDWVCMTGTVQISLCWMLLYQITNEEKYRDAAFVANGFVRSRMSIDGPGYKRGGIKGAFPVNGHYGAFSYLNWAAKFFVDANLLEMKIRLKTAVITAINFFLVFQIGGDFVYL